MTQNASKLDIAEHQAEDIRVLTLTGEITLDDGDLAFGRKIDELMARGDVRIVLDLAGVTRIDSSGIGMIVGKGKLVREKQGDIKLVALTRRTQHLMSMMKLVLVFETFEDEASAVRSFAWRDHVPPRDDHTS